MKEIQPSDKEITSTLIALRRYEKAMLAEDGDEMGDAVADLIVVQSIIEKLSAAKCNP